MLCMAKLQDLADRLPEDQREDFLQFAGRHRQRLMPALLFKEYLHSIKPDGPANLYWPDVLARARAYRFDLGGRLEGDVFHISYCNLTASKSPATFVSCSPETPEQLKTEQRTCLEKVIRRYVLLMAKLVRESLNPKASKRDDANKSEEEIRRSKAIKKNDLLRYERRGFDAGGCDLFQDLIVALIVALRGGDDFLEFLRGSVPPSEAKRLSLWPQWFEDEDEIGPSFPDWDHQFTYRLIPRLKGARRETCKPKWEYAAFIKQFPNSEPDESRPDDIPTWSETDRKFASDLIATNVVVRWKATTSLSERAIAEQLGINEDRVNREWHKALEAARRKLDAADHRNEYEQQDGTEAMAEVDRDLAERHGLPAPQPRRPDWTRRHAGELIRREELAIFGVSAPPVAGLPVERYQLADARRGYATLVVIATNDSPPREPNINPNWARPCPAPHLMPTVLRMSANAWAVASVPGSLAAAWLFRRGGQFLTKTGGWTDERKKAARCQSISELMELIAPVHVVPRPHFLSVAVAVD